MPVHLCNVDVLFWCICIKIKQRYEILFSFCIYIFKNAGLLDLELVLNFLLLLSNFIQASQFHEEILIVNDIFLAFDK